MTTDIFCLRDSSQSRKASCWDEKDGGNSHLQHDVNVWDEALMRPRVILIGRANRAPPPGCCTHVPTSAWQVPRRSHSWSPTGKPHRNLGCWNPSLMLAWCLSDLFGFVELSLQYFFCTHLYLSKYCHLEIIPKNPSFFSFFFFFFWGGGGELPPAILTVTNIQIFWICQLENLTLGQKNA